MKHMLKHKQEREILMKFENIVKEFKQLMCNVDGICGFVSEKSSDYLKSILSNIENTPITKVQFDQLLSLQNIRCVSDGFFKFYWLCKPKHFYKLADIDLPENIKTINTIKQLFWGFNRLFIDCLYVYGNIPNGFEKLAGLSYEELIDKFEKYIVDTSQIKSRGNTIKFNMINKGDRYLISEMACKTFANINSVKGLRDKLIEAYEEAARRGIRYPKFRDLLDGTYVKDENEQMSLFSFTDYLDETVNNKDELIRKADELYNRFETAHRYALENTDLYLSLSNDLDVYVATSMRKKDDFLDMANFCEAVFKSEELREFDLRYFDPTMSAADSHEDKGLIECLMVKSARMLIYSTGDKDSYGKDAEATMALCLGKPTIFFCRGNETRASFFRNVHPLSRLVNFETGVASGVIVCESEEEVIKIVKRIFTNEMSYNIEKKDENREYYLLKEASTGSVIRLQTDNKLLSSVFWNNYNGN